METDLIDYNAAGVVTSAAGMLANIDRNTDESESSLCNYLAAVRSRGSEFVKALANKKIRIKTIELIDGPQILETDPIRGLVKSGAIIRTLYNRLDPSNLYNNIAVQSLIVSNLENEKLLVPTSFNKEHDINISFWTNSQKWFEDTNRDVKMKQELTEQQNFSDTANITGYTDYGEDTVAAKALKVCKYQYGALQQPVKNAIVQKLKHSRGRMSRFTRLVIASMYHIALETRGGDAEVDTEKRMNDRIVEHTATNLGELGSVHNMAYVHCDRPDEPEYIAFLYIIAREFPFAYEMLKRERPDGQEVCKAASLNIREEAETIGIYCDSTPSWNGDRRIFVFNSDIWYAYMVNYARSINCEAELDLAYSSACLLMSHELLPNVSLPKRRSAGELFRRSLATKNVEDIVPNRFNVKEALFGGHCAAASAFCIYKDMVSHDALTSQRADVERTIMAHVIRDLPSREKWYRYMGAQGMYGSAQVLRAVDVLDFDTSDRICQALDRMNSLPYYCISPLNMRHSIAYGFTELLGRCPFQVRAKLDTQTPENRDRSLALMRNLSLVTGQRKRARLSVESPVYRDRLCQIAEGWIHPGEVSVVKGGARMHDTTCYIPPRRKLTKVVAPREFRGDTDKIDYDSDLGDDSMASSHDGDSTRSTLTIESTTKDKEVEEGRAEIAAMRAEEQRWRMMYDREMTELKLEVDRLRMEEIARAAEAADIASKPEPTPPVGEPPDIAAAPIEMAVTPPVFVEEATPLNPTPDRPIIPSIMKSAPFASRPPAKRAIPRPAPKSAPRPGASSRDANYRDLLFGNGPTILDIKNRRPATMPPEVPAIRFSKTPDIVTPVMSGSRMMPPKPPPKAPKVDDWETDSQAGDLYVSPITDETDSYDDSQPEAFDTVRPEMDNEELRRRAARMRIADFERRQEVTDKSTLAVSIANSRRSKTRDRIKNVRNLLEEHKNATFELSGSLPSYNNHRLVSCTVFILAESTSLTDNMIDKKLTIMKYWQRIPQMIDKCCAMVIAECIKECREHTNEWSKHTAGALGISQNFCHRVLRTEIVPRMIFHAADHPGMTNESAKRPSKEKVEAIQNVLRGWSYRGRVSVKVGNNNYEEVDIIEARPLDIATGLMHSSKALGRAYHIEDLVRYKKEWRDILTAPM